MEDSNKMANTLYPDTLHFNWCVLGHTLVSCTQTLWFATASHRHFKYLKFERVIEFLQQKTEPQTQPSFDYLKKSSHRW